MADNTAAHRELLDLLTPLLADLRSFFADDPDSSDWVASLESLQSIVDKLGAPLDAPTLPTEKYIDRKVADLSQDLAPERDLNDRLEREIRSLNRQLAKKDTRIVQLEGMINTPITGDFILAIRLEAAHQIERWGAEHDAGKTPPDWFWLLGWLAGKAVQAAGAGDVEKAKHHTISSAAVLLNWHRHLCGEDTSMRPGILPRG